VTGAVDVRVQHAGVTALDLMKGGRVAVLGGEVSVERFTGPLEVDAQRSTVQLQPAGPLADAVVARTTFGDIRLRVPEGSRMALEASSSGELTVDVPGLAVTREGGRATGTLAGGTNVVRLSADHGSVEVASALAAAASAADSRDVGDEDEDESADERRARRRRR
jgi:hypothetical protein